MPFCGTFEYIYWELGRSAPVGGQAARCAAPTAETWQARAARRVVAPYKRGVWSLPPHPPPSGAPSPRGEGLWGKHPSSVWLDRQSFTPLTRETAAYGRVRTPAPTAEFFGGNGGRTMCAPTGEEAGTCPLIRSLRGHLPPRGRLRKNKKGQVWDLSLKTQRRNAVSHKISLLPFFFKERKPRFRRTGAPGLLFQFRTACLSAAGVLDGGLGPCYPNIVTEMGTFRGAIIQILLR